MAADRDEAMVHRTPAPQPRNTNSTMALEALIETLGAGLVAVIVSADVTTVVGWVDTAVPTIDDESRSRLDATSQIVDLLLQHESGPVVRAWFMGVNPQLDDGNPAELLAQGRRHEVLAAARDFIEAG
ncbi:hypothetical protein [Humibacter antri]